MAYNIILFHYIPGDSILHKTSPGIKLIIALMYSILIFLLRLPVLFIILFAEIILIVTAKIRIKQIGKELKGFFLFLLIIFIFRAYSSTELIIVAKVIPLPPIHGLLAGGYMILRLCMVLFLGVLLTSTTTINQLIFFFFPDSLFSCLASCNINKSYHRESTASL
jgi:energy-coupling factor transport system permease protein